MSAGEARGTGLAGPLESDDFPAVLTARVVTPGVRPRLHGYDVEGDLARHYQPADVLYLSLVGELPTTEVSAALAVVLTFLSPVSVAHAATHGATLARLCGATTSATVGVAAIGLAEQARCLIGEHASLFAWLEAPGRPFPSEHLALDLDDDTAVSRLRHALSSTGVSVPGLDQRPSRSSAPLLVLHALGFRRAEQLEAAIVTARLPVAVAEALATRVVDFHNYPINLPRFLYEDS
jgi:hypothetical protein